MLNTVGLLWWQCRRLIFAGCRACNDQRLYFDSTIRFKAFKPPPADRRCMRSPNSWQLLKVGSLAPNNPICCVTAMFE